MPAVFPVVDDVSQIIIGLVGHHTILVDDNDNIMVMGQNKYGQLGLGDTTRRNTPTLFNL